MTGRARPRPSGSAPVEGLDGLVLVARNRCPYWHDQVGPEGSAACQVCLARHHESCWDEFEHCASCGEQRVLRAVPAPRGLEVPGARRALFATGAIGLLSLGLNGVGLWTDLGTDLALLGAALLVGSGVGLLGLARVGSRTDGQIRVEQE